MRLTPSLDRPPRVDVLAIASILVMGAVLLRVLILEPSAGFADNSDYDRIMMPAGFQPDTPNGLNEYGRHVNFHYLVVPPRNARMWYLSSERLIAIAVRFLSKPFLRNGRFDLRILGAAHGLLLLSGIGVMVAATRRLAFWRRLLAAVLIVGFFSDVAYIAVLNSFYGQVASYVFLLFAAGFAALALRDPDRSLWPALYFSSVLLFVTSKPQETSQVIPAMVLFLILAPRTPAPVWKRPEVLMSAAGAAIAAAYFVSGSVGMKPGQSFNLVFNQLVPYSGRPAEALEELGFPPRYRKFVGAPRYGPDAPLNRPEFRKAVVSRVSYARIATFYCRHPRVAVRMLAQCAPAAFAIRDPKSGRYSKDSGLPPGARANWPSWWSRLRGAGRRHAGVLLAIFLGSNLIAWTGLFARRLSAGVEWKAAAAVAILAAMAAGAYAIVALASMPIDLERKLLTFDVMMDLLLIVDVVAISGALPRVRRP